MNGVSTFEQDFIAHHGIKGQKWGVRRFQNKDGSLTPNGVKRVRELEQSESIQKVRQKHPIANPLRKNRS